MRDDIRSDWTGFTGLVNVLNTSGTDDFRVANEYGFPNARLNLGNEVVMYSRLTAGTVLPISALSGNASAAISASGGSGAGAQNALTLLVGG